MSSIVSKRILLQLRNKAVVAHQTKQSSLTAGAAAAMSSMNIHTRSFSTILANYPTSNDATLLSSSSSVSSSVSSSLLVSPSSHPYYFQKKNLSDGPTNTPIKTDESSSSSSATNTNTDTTTIDTVVPLVDTMVHKERPPSILTQTFQNKPYNIGQAWFTLQNHLAGGEQIRHEDLISLCTSIQPTSPRDTKLLIKILKDLKRCNRFIISKEIAELCVISMAKGLLPEGGVEHAMPYYKVVSGLKIGNDAFLNRNTGLYVSCDTSVLVQYVLHPLLDGLQDMQTQVKSSTTTTTTTTTSNDDVPFGEEYPMLLEKGRTLVQGMFELLLTRASTPTRQMKKRAKRSYLKYVRCCSGPCPQSVDVMVRICLVGDDNEEGIEVAKAILERFEEHAFLGRVMESTSVLVQEAEERLKAWKEQEVEGDGDGDGDDADGDGEK